MQTFLPFPNYRSSAFVLDDKRLGKQRVETLQIMTALRTGSGWVHHPATKMWAGHEAHLLWYQRAVCAEWVSRGYADTCMAKTVLVAGDLPASPVPWWLGNEAFHASHRVNLYRKDPEQYSTEADSFGGEYLWPLSPGVFRIGRKGDKLGEYRV